MSSRYSLLGIRQGLCTFTLLSRLSSPLALTHFGKCFGLTFQAVKVVRQRYTSTPETLYLLEQFRQMLNDCVRIGLVENVTSLKSLSLKAYEQLAGYDMMSYYKVCAVSRATGILRNYRKAKRLGKPVKEPHASRPQLVTCYGFRIRGRRLLVPFKPKQPIRIPLNSHTLEVLSQPPISPRSIMLTDQTISITFAKSIAPMEPVGFIGVDNNLDNIATVDSNSSLARYDTSKATMIKAKDREVMSHMTRNDARVRRRVYRKYGQKQRNRVTQLLHHISKQVVAHAKENRFGIVMERLTGLRRLYRRSDRQSRWYRARMNSWSYVALQRQIEYKAHWEGIPVIYVNPRGTSAKCSICGAQMVSEENRMLRCGSCEFTVDRDVNAAKNILARGLRFGPVAPATEAMVQEPSHEREGTLKVDAGELTSQTLTEPLLPDDSW